VKARDDIQNGVNLREEQVASDSEQEDPFDQNDSNASTETVIENDNGPMGMSREGS
jgi:hypothetical protein